VGPPAIAVWSGTSIGGCVNRRTVCVGALCAGLLVACAAPGLAVNKGLAKGQVGLITTASRAYGYSAGSSTWSSRALQGRVLDQRACDYLGFVLTTDKILAYNSIADLWVESTYTGNPVGVAADGAVIVFWTNQACYGIATLWALWRSESIDFLGSHATGGASAGNFGLVWSGYEAHAYSGSSGQWCTLLMNDPALGGIAEEGLGLVWTCSAVYAYRPLPSEWIPLDAGRPQGISIVGGGRTGLAWDADAGYAFSTVLGTWTPVAIPEGALGGTAAGDVALVWSNERVYCFNAQSGLWTAIEINAEKRFESPVPPVDESSFGVSPNPCAAPSVAFSLPGGEPWSIEIFDLEGRSVRALALPAQSAGGHIDWDRRDAAGEPLPSGTYWARAQAGERTEARRIVLLP
jgi:hypothetical protein